MCVCVYIYICVCVYIYMCIYVYVYTVCVCMYIFYVYVYMCVYIYIYIYSIYIYTVDVYLCVCVCVICLPDKFEVERYLHGGLCLDACPEAFYHSEERRCEPCSDRCRFCTGPTRCLQCNASYLSHGVCVKLECGEGKQGHGVVYEMAFCSVNNNLEKALSLRCLIPFLSILFFHTLFSGEVEDPDYDDCMACEEGCRKCVLCRSPLGSRSKVVPAMIAAYGRPRPPRRVAARVQGFSCYFLFEKES